MTRKRIEQITSKELGGNTPNFEGNILNIFRGRAGTGKTINLIKIAIKLVDEESARVQILTYNRALVSDIRRLFTLAELPDMFEDKCVSVNTIGQNPCILQRKAKQRQRSLWKNIMWQIGKIMLIISGMVYYRFSRTNINEYEIICNL